MIHAVRRIEGGDGRECRILNVNEGPNAFAVSDQWNLAASCLLAAGSVGAVPGVRPVKEAVAKGDALHRAVVKTRFSSSSVSAGSGSNAGTGIDGQAFCLVRQSVARLEEEAARLLQVASDANRACRPIEIAAPLESQRAIAGGRGGQSAGSFGNDVS